MTDFHMTTTFRPKVVEEAYFTASTSTRNRPKGLPELGEMFRSPREPSSTVERPTPYRLPKLGGEGSQADGEKVVWSRHGFEQVPQRSLDLITFAGKHKTSPSKVVQELRRSKMYHPSFQHAMITPSSRQSVQDTYHIRRKLPKINVHPVSQSLPDDSILEDYLGQNIGGGYTPPPPHSRTVSPTKSANSIHWTLSPYKNLNFDKKGQGRVQGPYSREFTVTCSAPSNWLRMKLGRTKTTVV